MISTQLSHQVPKIETPQSMMPPLSFFILARVAEIVVAAIDRLSFRDNNQ